MVLKISSKFELQRFCRTTSAVAIVSILGLFNMNLCNAIEFLLIFSCLSCQQLKLSAPNPDDLGYVDSISVEEIGGVRV